MILDKEHNMIQINYFVARGRLFLTHVFGPAISSLVVGSYLLSLLVCKDLVAQALTPQNEQFTQTYASPKILQELWFPMDKTWHLNLHHAYLSGDKFLNAHGLGVTGSYYFNHSFALRGDFSYYKNFKSDELDGYKNQGINPLLTNPEYTIKAGVLWAPLFGKLAAKDSVLNFFLGPEAGLIYAKEESFPYVDSYNVRSTRPSRRYGFYLGPHFHLPASEVIRLEMSAHFMSYRYPFDARPEWKRIWNINFGVGLCLF